MQHRHINTAIWTREAIDSALERGNLSDWQDLFRSASLNPELAKDVSAMAERHRDDGTFAIVEYLLHRMYPELFAHSSPAENA